MCMMMNDQTFISIPLIKISKRQFLSGVCHSLHLEVANFSILLCCVLLKICTDTGYGVEGVGFL